VISLDPSGRLVPRLFAADAISKELREAARSGQVQHIVVTRADGLVIGHNLPTPDLAKRLAAMSAAIVGTAIMASSELERGTFRVATLEASEGRIMCMSAGPQAIVAGMANKSSDMDRVSRLLRGLANQVEEAIDQWDGGALKT